MWRLTPLIYLEIFTKHFSDFSNLCQHFLPRWLMSHNHLHIFINEFDFMFWAFIDNLCALRTHTHKQNPYFVSFWNATIVKWKEFVHGFTQFTISNLHTQNIFLSPLKTWKLFALNEFLYASWMQVLDWFIKFEHKKPLIIDPLEWNWINPKPNIISTSKNSTQNQIFIY